jgi:hypothetical protein
MQRTSKTLVAWMILGGGLASCGEAEAPGFLWDVTTVVTGNFCFQAEEGWTEEFTYKLAFEGAAVNLSIGDDQFASGSISGCQVVYHSVVWMEPRDGFELRWKIDGEAYYRQSGGCENFLDDNRDWQGTETFTVVNSEHPDYPVGCTMELEVQGTYAGAIE